MRPKPLKKLKSLLFEKFDKIWLSARALDVRDEMLSSFLSGRRVLDEITVKKLERLLSRQRDEFLPAGYCVAEGVRRSTPKVHTPVDKRKGAKKEKGQQGAGGETGLMQAPV